MEERQINGKTVKVEHGKITVDGVDRTADAKGLLGPVLHTPDDEMLDAVEGLIIGGLLR